MTPARFEELYERYAEGSLADGERTEFLAALEQREYRARLVELSAYETAVREELSLAGKGERSSRSTSYRLRRVLAPQAPPPQDLPARRLFAGIAAAFVLAVVVILASGSPAVKESKRTLPLAGPLLRPEAPRPEPAPEVREAPPAPRPPEPRPLENPPTPRPPPPKVEAPRPEPPPAIAAPEPRPEPLPKPEPAPTRESVTFIAKIERTSGEVRIGADPAEAGRGIVAGQGVTTGAGSYALVRFPDGTRLELGAETALSRLTDGAAGKSAQLERGLATVEAARQAAGKPLVVTAPFAEASVLGTEFSLWATPAFTRLDVREGRVKFTRLPGISSVVVGAGHYAIAGPAVEFAVKPVAALWKAPAAGLLLWLRADAGVKTADAAGGVALWTDQSPSGNTASQPAPAAQPLLVPNAAGVRPAVRFDGKEDFFVLPQGFGDFKSGLSAFVVVRPSAGGAWTRFLDLDKGPACDNIVFGRKDTAESLGFWIYANGQTKGKVEAPGAVVADQLQAFSVILAGQGRATLYKNGQPVGTGQTSVPLNVTRAPNGIGKSNSGDPFFKGDLFEVLLFNRTLGDAERAYIDGYLNSKYFDATTPPPMNRPAEK